MELQLVEVYCPNEHFSMIDRELKKLDHVSYWVTSETRETRLIRILVKTGQAEAILNYLEGMMKEENFHVLLFPVQTYLSPEEKKEKEEEEERETEEDQELVRASRQELYSVVQDAARMSKGYIWFVALSSLVSVIGILKNSPATVIGAMVIAPLINPTISLSFAAVLGDIRLVFRLAGTILFGITVPILVAVLFGTFTDVPVYSTELMSRTNIEMIDIIAALASGAAGALSFLKRRPGVLVGVMVAVALVPPASVLGIALGSGLPDMALTPFLLLLVNLNSIFLSGILFFWSSGIQPTRWREIKRANTSRKYSLLFFGLSCLFLILAILGVRR
ncbi:putative hydrophobic protein (TIGR00341 family) [Melghirimyces profundicolus]|uniref:Putative hydrophobic protein (TIGR00341 family) n=1 Tax=Melghirimyces profundicolus TaxID=1242148 RepID=A0A2T6BCK1_9BACL|nr:TIGR00341 family protein [Melghirimyces profundicolus]PTX53756.1 putative hydrophobic protein (TIGR00341 family) [Melghirimyces profundicolus]